MFVYLKQSGELLASNGEAGDLWTPDGVRASAEKVVATYDARRKLGLNGLTLVSGAGNIIRGEKLRAHGIANGQADLLGRLATVQNTLVLAHALRHRGVPVTTFLTDNMALQDGSLHGDMQPYSLDSMLQAFEDEQVVLIGGGTGEDGVTTDNAVMTYANEHQRSEADAEIVVLKGTKYDGVYDNDPAKYATARRIPRIAAQRMLRDYSQFPVVDESCLVQIGETGLAMRVYRDGQHDLSTVLSHHGEDADSIGTLIVSDPSA